MTKPEMTTGQKRECLEFARQFKNVEGFPGGRAFIVDLFLAMLSKAGLTLVDRADFEKLKAQHLDHQPRRPERPCGDCLDGICVMNCGPSAADA